MFRTLLVVFVALYGAVFSDSLAYQTHDQPNNSTAHTTTPSLHSLNYTGAEVSTFRDLVLATHVKELRKPQKKLENDKSRRKRSIFNLYSMIGCATDFSRLGRLALLDYGNYCGWGGSGRPIDRIDRCCQRHDNCYEWVMYDYDKWTWSMLFRSYKWYCNGGDPFCASYQTTWKREACLCDLKFVKCLQSL